MIQIQCTQVCHRILYSLESFRTHVFSEINVEKEHVVRERLLWRMCLYLRCLVSANRKQVDLCEIQTNPQCQSCCTIQPFGHSGLVSLQEKK